MKETAFIASPVPTNLLKTRKLDDYFHKLLEEQRGKRDLAIYDTLLNTPAKILNIMGRLSKMLCRFEETKCAGPTEFDIEKLSGFCPPGSHFNRTRSSLGNIQQTLECTDSFRDRKKGSKSHT